MCGLAAAHMRPVLHLYVMMCGLLETHMTPLLHRGGIDLTGTQADLSP